MLNQIELKKHYNAILKRIKKAEKYYETHKVDKHFKSLLALIKTQNALLEHITDASNEEVQEGFNLEIEKWGVNPWMEMVKIRTL